MNKIPFIDNTFKNNSNTKLFIYNKPKPNLMAKSPKLTFQHPIIPRMHTTNTITEILPNNVLLEQPIEPLRTTPYNSPSIYPINVIDNKIGYPNSPRLGSLNHTNKFHQYKKDNKSKYDDYNNDNDNRSIWYIILKYCNCLCNTTSNRHRNTNNENNTHDYINYNLLNKN
jgi:hypothetical protein